MRRRGLAWPGCSGGHQWQSEGGSEARRCRRHNAQAVPAATAARVAIIPQWNDQGNNQGQPLLPLIAGRAWRFQRDGRSSSACCAGTRRVTGRHPQGARSVCNGRLPGRTAVRALADVAGLRIRLLGGFEVTVDDRPVAADAWRLRKAKTLVKLLALARSHRLHREALVAVLWPDRDEVSATNNLHQALYVARRVLAGTPDAVCSLRDDVVLLSEGTMPWLDTEAFDTACRRARQTRDPQDYRAAAELYRGDLLPEDRFEEWTEGPREALRERHLGLLVEYAEVLSDRGEHTQVVDIAGAATAADPFHEHAQRTLMTALRRADAGTRPWRCSTDFARRWPRSTPPTLSRQPGGSTGTFSLTVSLSRRRRRWAK